MIQSIVHVFSIPLIHGNSKKANVSSHTRLAVWGLASEYDACTHDLQITIHFCLSITNYNP